MSFSITEPSSRQKWIAGVLVVTYAVLTLIPLIWIIATGFTTPQDVKSVGMDVLRHRVIASYEAEAEGVTSTDIVRRVFESVRVP